MKSNDKKAVQNNSMNKKMESEKYLEPQTLTDDEKKKLQVKDGQNNHHVDERGGF